MSASVRIFSHTGVVSVPIANQALQASDAAFLLLTQPYKAGEALTADAVAVTSSVNTAPAGSALLAIEVQNGKTIAYEVTNENADLRVATANSPYLTGRNVISFGPGSRLSVLEIT